MAGRNVTLGTLISILLFSEASLTIELVFGMFPPPQDTHSSHPEPRHKHIHHNNAVVPVEPFVCDRTPDVFMKMQTVMCFLCCATAWQDISQLLSRNHVYHVNTVQSVS